MSLLYIGIDPGVSGAIAYVVPGQEAFVSKVPVMKLGPRSVIDGLDLHRLLSVRHAPLAAIGIEHVHSMPQQGVASTFTFGAAFGAALALAQAQGTPVHVMRPDQWRKLVGLPHKADKYASLGLAGRLYPGVTIGRNHNMADALLLAHAAMLSSHGNTG